MNNPNTANGIRRQRGLIGLAGVVLLVAGGWFGYWLLHGRYYETTDDAYVAANIVQITSEVDGTVVAVHADDTDQVRRGQLLVALDPADATIAMASAKAELARAVRRIRGLFAQAGALEAQIEQRDIAVKRARADLERRESLDAAGAISAEQLAHARNDVAELQAALATAQSQLAATRAAIDGATIGDNPQVRAAAAAVEQAALALRRTRITAPVTGVVARRGVQLGAHVASGEPLMAVVPLAQVWVDANFKEVQLEHIRLGQPAAVTADLYGDNVVYHGRVAGLAAGSGAAFALLPPQNASGNWIKIVQRVPVRIALDPDEVAAHPLRVGLSITAEVDIHDQSGPLLANDLAVVDATLPAPPDSEAVRANIARIIAENAGTPPPERAL